MAKAYERDARRARRHWHILVPIFVTAAVFWKLDVIQLPERWDADAIEAALEGLVR